MDLHVRGDALRVSVTHREWEFGGIRRRDRERTNTPLATNSPANLFATPFLSPSPALTPLLTAYSTAAFHTSFAREAEGWLRRAQRVGVRERK